MSFDQNLMVKSLFNRVLVHLKTTIPSNTYIKFNKHKKRKQKRKHNKDSFIYIKYIEYIDKKTL